MNERIEERIEEIKEEIDDLKYEISKLDDKLEKLEDLESQMDEFDFNTREVVGEKDETCEEIVNRENTIEELRKELKELMEEED